MKKMSSKDRRKIIAIDLDGTLTKVGYFKDLWEMTFLDLEKVYENVKPRKDIIKKVNRLYDRGFIIYIFTSRYDLYQHLTKHWLKKHGVKYHYFIMNKNFYDILIDDKAYRPEEMDEILKKNLCAGK